MTLPKFHHSQVIDVDLDNAWDLSPIFGIIFQIVLILGAVGISWVYYWYQQMALKDSDPNAPTYEEKTFNGYRNYDENRDGPSKETLYPGNPSKFKREMDVPYFTLKKLKETGGGGDEKTEKLYVALADKVFDVTTGIDTKDLPNIPGDIEWEHLYGHDLTYAAALSQFKSESLGQKLNLAEVSPEQRKAFYAFYMFLYKTYPISGTVEGGGKYLALLRDAKKFNRPNYFW